jgi:hypothetical protein
MNRLTRVQIDDFANKIGARKIAVSNFLLTLHNCGTKQNAICNLSKDAKLYNWNQETINAIMDGIKFCFGD